MESLLERLYELDNDLYKARYIDKDYVKRQSIWDSIKNDKDLLMLAIEVVKDKFGKRDTFRATDVVECMLIAPKEVDIEVYQTLVDKIYSSTDLARTVLDGASNGGYSFLLYTIQNDELELTEEQREFALSEAMNKIGTSKIEALSNEGVRKILDESNPKNALLKKSDKTTLDSKELIRYSLEFYLSLSMSQAHGRGEYDIRYYILKNHNFEDKFEKLVFDFYADDEEYDEVLETWENDIVNISGIEDEEPVIYIDDVMFITPEEVYNRLPKEVAQRVIEEINFVKRLHEIRPQQWELEAGFGRVREQE